MNKHKPKYIQIIDAAVEVIAEHGYYYAKISDIAKKAGVADGTIYLYFENKEAILMSVFEEKMGTFIEEIAIEIDKQTTVLAKLDTLVENHLRQLSRNKPMAIVTQFELRQSKADLRSKVYEIVKPYLEMIEELVLTGMDTKELEADLYAPVVRQMIFGTIDDVVTNWVMNGQVDDLLSYIPHVQKLIRNSIINRSEKTLSK